MTIRWVMVGLLSFCSRSYCQDCNKELLENVDFPGSDITSVYSPDVEHCQLMCTQHPSCLFFTFIRPDWTRDDRHFYCYLKSTPSGRPNTETPLLGVTSGYSLKPCSPEEKHCLSKVYQNVDFPGADFKMFFTADYEECQRACTHEPGCQFFTFLNEAFSSVIVRYKCHLKFSWNVPMTPNVERTAGLVSGFSHNSFMTQSVDADCRSKLFPSTAIPGSDFLQVTASSPEHCQSLCSAHPSCTYFSFNSEQFQCYLKRNWDQLNAVAKDEIISGLPTRYCHPDNSWVKVPLEGIDFHGSDIRDEHMDDPDTCQRTCTDDPSCQFYTHTNRNFHDPDYRRRCYLKREIVMPAPPKVTKLTNAVSGFTLKNCGV